MSEEMVIRNCSPTLAGLKTGNLFACPREGGGDIRESLRDLNRRMVPRGVRILPVKEVGDRTLLYMYRPEKLARDLRNPLAEQILGAREYPLRDTERCVFEMLRRLREEKEFPHEVGLFLGYPAEDVNGFMTVGPQGARCVGTWRVYGDEAAAKKRFALYKKCTGNYLKAYNRQTPLEKLVVNNAKM